MTIEISFPRGGRKPPANHTKSFKKPNLNLFGKTKRVQRRDERPENKKQNLIEVNANEDSDILAKSADLLSYRTLQDGMVLLGCVREVKKMSLNILLPGRLSGNVFVTHISKPYSKLLQTIIAEGHSEDYKTLQQMFKPGQHVAVKVLQRETTDNKIDVSLSMLSSDINSEIMSKDLFVGMTLWCSVSSVEEHGYIIDTGIENCRAFLSKKNVEKKTFYCVGEPLWCVIQKHEALSGAVTITLNALETKVALSKIMKEVNINSLLPGSQIDLEIEEVLNNGVQGRFLDNYIGYIHQGQLQGLFDRPQKYSVGKVVTARILYTVPITKLTYFTLKSFEIEPRVLEDGQLMSCQVFAKVRGGLYLKLDKKYRGFVSTNRLKSIITNDEVLKKKYKIGSTHKCRVLSYDWLDRSYVCTLQKDLCKAETVTGKDIKLGQDVTATIKEIQEKGLLVKIDFVNGFILNCHLTDVVLSSYGNIKLKYNVGDEIKARVLSIKEDKSVLLTMKPSLMTDENLMDYSQIKVNEQFPGMVCKVNNKGIVVLFYGDINGWIPRSHLSFEKIKNPETRFQIGQVVKCTILKFEPETKKLFLSLLPPKFTCHLKLGEHVSGVISRMLNSGIEISIHDSNITAVVPMQHLTKCPSLANAVLETYNEDDAIDDLVYVNLNKDVVILSLRDQHLNESTIPDFEDIEKNDILQCSFESIEKIGFFLNSPIKNFHGNIIVKNDSKKIKKEWKRLNRFQTIFAKVFSKDIKTISVTIDYKNMWNYDLEISKNVLKDYLREVKKLKTYWNNKHLPMAEYKLGDAVTGIVSEIDDDFCYVEFDNGDRAFVDIHHRSGDLVVGAEVVGRVLWLDFVKKQIEICLKPNIMSRINKTQDAKVTIDTKIINAEILLVKQDFVMVTLGPSKNRQLAFLPARVHPNDFEPDLSQYEIGSSIEVKISEVFEDNILVLAKDIKKGQKNKKLKRKLMEDDFESPKKKIKKEVITEESSMKTKQKRKRNSNSKSTVTGNFNEEHTTDVSIPKKKRKRKKKSITVKEEVFQKNDETIETTVNDDEDMTEIKKRKSKKLKTQTEESSDKLLQNVPSETKKMKTKKSNQPKEEISVKEEEISEENTITTKSKKKRIKSISNDDTIEKQDNSNSHKVSTKKKKSIKNNVTTEIEKQTNKTDAPKIKFKEQKFVAATSKTDNTSNNKLGIVLPGISNFWSVPESQNSLDNSSSEDDEEVNMSEVQKKKKLTPAERAEEARLEEERLRQIEIELADPGTMPKNADNFDRLILANPNSSHLWINYMAFHLEATEIEKARVIARKALNTIEFREDQEKFNVWIAFLNLENRYGSKDSFNTVLQEATKMNDALTIYLQALHILSDSKKSTEFIELLMTVTRKFKHEPSMWIKSAESCHKCEMHDQARNLMQRAMKSLEERQHINILVQFALMESKYAEHERAEAIFEKILASYPKRVDIWCTYIDMLIKGNRISIARNVMERSVAQKLPIKKMKTLYGKFVNFETKYGNENSVKKVRESAAEYVKSSLK